MAGETEAAPQAAAVRTAGGQPREDEETERLRVAAYLAAVRGGDRETAGRIAGEMRALGGAEVEP